MSDYLTELNEHYKKVRARLSPKCKVELPAPKSEPIFFPEPVIVAPPADEAKKEYPMKGVFLPSEIKEQIRNVLIISEMQWEEAIGVRKTNRHLIVRAKIYALLRNHGWSYYRIGKLCGSRDHSTIWNSMRILDKWEVDIAKN